MKISRVAARGGFALALGILILVGILSYQSNRSLVGTENAIFHSQAIVNALDDLLVQVLSAESAERAFLVSPEDAFVDPQYVDAKVGATLGRLEDLLRDDPKQLQSFQSLRQVIDEKLSFHNRMIDTRRNSGPDASLQLFLTGRGHALMDQARECADVIREAANRLLREQIESAQRVAEQSAVTLTAGTLLSFAILLSVYRHLNREIVRRHASENKVLHLNRLYAVLSRVSQSIVHIRDRDELFRAVCRIAVEDGRFRMAWIGVIRSQDQVVEPVAMAGFDDGYLAGIRVTTAESAGGLGPTGRALRERRHFVCSDIATDPLMLPWREAALSRGYRSSAAFPILFESSVIGAFSVYATEPGFFDEEMVALLGEVTADISFALEVMEREEARRLAEQEVLRLNQGLEQRVAERTSELERMTSELEIRNREVERANRMKTDFLARMSHELRTPLNAIVGYSDLLAEEPAGPLPPTYKRFSANIQEGARHLLQMVNDLLDLSKIEAGRIDLNREVFPPAGAVEEVLSVITPLARIKNITIEDQLPPRMFVNADRTRFKQILYNLLSNAVKFTPEGGRVWIADCGHEDTACFCVGDTGIGIPAGELSDIFNEFHQAGAAAAPTEGTGLGLSITRRLAELHGGSAWAESIVGQGSRFFCSLGPQSLERAAAAPGEI
jgi:signal transduction histidine kinase/CHASE3 domain sensor protein